MKKKYIYIYIYYLLEFGDDNNVHGQASEDFFFFLRNIFGEKASED